jgi:sulfatase modifying factor 1
MHRKNRRVSGIVQCWSAENGSGNPETDPNHEPRQSDLGSFSYATVEATKNQPVLFVSWNDAARFTNWLHNGQGMGSTETGAYDMTSGTPVRLAGAKVFLPSENEWYKAAYHDPRGSAAGGPPGDDNYWLYPTQSDTAPVEEAPPGGLNSATFDPDDPDHDDAPDSTAVGAYTNTTSFYRAFDMGGNAWEWNEGIPSPGFRSMRGGGRWSSVFHLQSSFENFAVPAGDQCETTIRVATAQDDLTRPNSTTRRIGDSARFSFSSRARSQLAHADTAAFSRSHGAAADPR